MILLAQPVPPSADAPVDGRWGDERGAGWNGVRRYGCRQTKFAASSMLPVPV